MVMGIIYVMHITPFEVAFLETSQGDTLWWSNRFIDSIFVLEVELGP